MKIFDIIIKSRKQSELCYNKARQTECMITKIPLSVVKMAVISDNTHITTINN